MIKEAFLHFVLSLVVWYNRLKIQLLCLLAKVLVIQLGFICSILAELLLFNHLGLAETLLAFKNHTFTYTDITMHYWLIKGRMCVYASCSKLSRRHLGILVNSSVAPAHFRSMLELRFRKRNLFLKWNVLFVFFVWYVICTWFPKSKRCTPPCTVLNVSHPVHEGFNYIFKFNHVIDVSASLKFKMHLLALLKCDH